MKTYTIKAIKGTWTGSIPYEVSVDEQEIRNLIKENPELLTPTPTHKRKYFVPKTLQDYWYIHDEGRIEDCINGNGYDTKARIATGNCFATQQDAQDELNRRQALVRIWNNYDDKYSWDIDWSNTEQSKYSIIYDHNNNKIEGETWRFEQHNTQLPYFKSAEDRNQFVEDNCDDLLVVFNIKK